MIKIEETKETIEIFKNRTWKNQSNKNLIENKKLKIHVSSLKNLDDIGFNYLEILSISDLIGKTIHKLPKSDTDFLDLMQEKYQIVFNFEDKIKNKRNIKLNNFVFNFDKQKNCWLGVSSLFLKL